VREADGIPDRHQAVARHHGFVVTAIFLRLLLPGTPATDPSPSVLDRLPFHSGCDQSWEDDPSWFVVETVRSECQDSSEV